VALAWLPVTASARALLGPLVGDRGIATSLRRFLGVVVATIVVLVVTVRVLPVAVLSDPSIRAAVVITVLLLAILLVTARTAHELVAASRVRERQAAWLASLVDAMSEVLWTTDATGRFVEPQRSWEAWTGQSWEAHRDTGWVDAIHPDDRAGLLARWEHALATREPYEATARAWHAGSGAHRAIVARAVPVEVEGTVTEWVGTISDVEDLRVADRELREANARLERRVAERTRELQASNRDLRQFAYVASHDLQEPHRAITGFTQLLARHLDGDLDELGRHYVDVVLEATARQRALLDDLLLLSRVQRHRVTPGPVDLDDALATVRAELGHALAEADLHVPTPLPTVHADRVLVMAVLRNLLANAAKFHEPGERASVEVSAGTDETGWRLRVADRGIGIPVGHQQRIWEPFQRLHTREEYPGTGVGLGIVRSAVERLGGQVELDSAPGAGARFTVHVPDRVTPR
jgi:PAS domain S-box-containing protein